MIVVHFVFEPQEYKPRAYNTNRQPGNVEGAVRFVFPEMSESGTDEVDHNKTIVQQVFKYSAFE
jgi:hypothetical protein